MVSVAWRREASTLAARPCGRRDWPTMHVARRRWRAAAAHARGLISVAPHGGGLRALEWICCSLRWRHVGLLSKLLVLRLVVVVHGTRVDLFDTRRWLIFYIRVAARWWLFLAWLAPVALGEGLALWTAFRTRRIGNDQSGGCGPRLRRFGLPAARRGAIWPLRLGRHNRCRPAHCAVIFSNFGGSRYGSETVAR